VGYFSQINSNTPTSCKNISTSRIASFFWLTLLQPQKGRMDDLAIWNVLSYFVNLAGYKANQKVIVIP